MPEILQLTLVRRATAAMFCFQDERSANTLTVAAVVKDEARAGAGFDELLAIPELGVPDAHRSKLSIEIAQQPDPPDELRVEAITGGGRAGPVEHLPQAFDDRFPGERFDVLREPLRGRPPGDHRAGEQTAPAATKLDYGSRFLLMLIGLNIHLHVNSLDDVQALAGPAIIVEAEVAVQR